MTTLSTPNPRAKALSWSELSIWEQDPTKHYRMYVQGISDPSTPQQELGSIVHKTIESPNYPWLKEMVSKSRPRHEQVIVRKLLDKIEGKRPKESEVFTVAQTPEGIPLLAIFDGLDKQDRILYEYKTSSGSYWNQKTVDRHGQLTFYAYIYRLTFHQYFKEIQLHRLHTKTGTVKSFYTARGPMDLIEIHGRIKRCYDQLNAQGLWTLRKSKKERLKESQTMLPLSVVVPTTN